MAFSDSERAALDDHLEQAVRRGMTSAIRDAMQDKELLEEFWKQGFQHLSTHATNNASQWIGKRILTSLILAVTTAGIIWLARHDALK